MSQKLDVIYESLEKFIADTQSIRVYIQHAYHKIITEELGVFVDKLSVVTNHSWYQSSRVIALSCGIKIFAVRCLVLSQYTHLTDGQTDRRIDGQTDRQNCDSNTVRCITCSRTVKIADIATAFIVFGQRNEPANLCRYVLLISPRSSY